MKSRSKFTSTHETGSASGPWTGFLRTTDWYNDSENNFNKIWDKTYMCQISTQNGLRHIVRICDSPDPSATFSKKFTEPLVGTSEIGSGTARSNKLYWRDEVWMYLDKSELPYVIDSFSADGKQAYANCGVVGNYADSSYQAPEPDQHGNKMLCATGDYIDDQFVAPCYDQEGKLLTQGETAEAALVPVVIYPCRFVRVALNSNCYGCTSGAVDVYLNEEGKKRVSVTITATFAKNYLNQYPITTCLRLQKRTKRKNQELYVDYVPAHPIQGDAEHPAADEFGKVRYYVDDLDLDAHYSPWVLDITPYDYDGSAIKEKKVNLKTLIADPVYFAKLRTITNAMANGKLPNNTPQDDIDACMYYWNAAALAQPSKLSKFSTPPDTDSKEDIPFMAGSCFAGTLNGYKNAYEIEHKFNVLVGDVSYNDNCRDNKSDFMHNYLGWLKNKNGQATLNSKSLYTLRDDHEVVDNWYSNIFISAFNTPKYRLDNGAWTGPENDLYNAIATNPQTAAKIVFRKTNQYSSFLTPSNRIKNAIEANNQTWPTLPAHGVTENGCFAVPWGKLLAIFLNVNPTQNADGSTNYHFVEGVASPDNTTFTRDTSKDEGYNYIPPKSLEFLKEQLENSKAEGYAVFFSKDIGCVFNNRYEFLSHEFTKIAKQAQPNVAQEVIDSLRDRLFYAFNFNSSDGFHPQINNLIDWMKAHKCKNVFFITGDPHATLFKYLDEDNVYVSCCSSSLSTYHASGGNMLLATNIDSDKTILALASNSYADFLFSPSERKMFVVLRYGDQVRAAAEIPLARGGWW